MDSKAAAVLFEVFSEALKLLRRFASVELISFDECDSESLEEFFVLHPRSVLRIVTVANVSTE